MFTKKYVLKYIIPRHTMHCIVSWGLGDTFGGCFPRVRACPPSLTNRCETQYFDGKKGKCHSATSLRIYDASTYFFKMNRRPFSLKLLQNKLAEKRVLMWQPLNIILSLSFLNQPTNDYVFTSLALISICGLSPIVRRKLWLNLLWATPRLLVSSFHHLPEEWNCERRGNINL